MKKALTIGERIEKLRNDRGQTQTEFAKGVGVTQGAVSAWERDDKDRAPSSDIFFRLAGLASESEDSLFWLEQAGVTPQALLAAANKILEDQTLQPGATDLIRVLPLPGQKKSEEREAILRATDIPDLSFVGYLIVDDQSADKGLAPGDLLVVDTSQRDGPYLKPFFQAGDIVLEREGKFYAGRLFLEPLTGDPPDNWAAVLRLPGLMHPACQMVLAKYECDAKTPGWELRKEAAEKIRRPPEWHILGSVIVRYPGQTRQEEPSVETTARGGRTVKEQLRRRKERFKSWGLAEIPLTSAEIEVHSENVGTREKPKWAKTIAKVSCEADMKPDLFQERPKLVGELHGYTTRDGHQLYFEAKTGKLVDHVKKPETPRSAEGESK
jgi:transcriptional regulator with XRE-family HTH domain